jgi:hypothetical protein
MANLLGQNIGANYRGILNLDATTINTPLNATLRAVTDGMGNTSQLFLSTTQVNIGGGSSLGRLVARGDGINVVARFESNSFANILSVRESDHTLLFGVGVGSLFPQIGLQTLNNPTSFATGNGQGFGYKSNFNMDWPAPMHSFYGENQIYNRVTLSNIPAGIAAFNGTFGISNVAASTFDYRMLNISYTINNTAASNRNATGIFLNATETALNGMGHNLMDLGTGGTSFVSRFTIANTGFIRNAGNDISKIMLQLGGTTSAFPAIKRNGTTIDFRLADDSGSASISANIISGSILTVTQSWALTYRSNNGDIWATLSGTGATTKVSSKVLWNFDGLPTTRPATVGDLYVDTAANILANGDKIVAIRV